MVNSLKCSAFSGQSHEISVDNGQTDKRDGQSFGPAVVAGTVTRESVSDLPLMILALLRDTPGNQWSSHQIGRLKGHSLPTELA